MGIDMRYPEKHADFITRCHEAGQVRPTPLLLQCRILSGHRHTLGIIFHDAQ